MTEANPIPIEFRGFTVWAIAHAGDERGTVYASLIGRVTAVKAVWAAFHSDYSLGEGAVQIRKRSALDGAKYHTIKVKLQTSGWVNWALVHTQATQRNLPDEDFYMSLEEPTTILDSPDRPGPILFMMQWYNAMDLPAKLEWGTRMWNDGLSAELIEELPSHGVRCWRVKADAAGWQEIVTKIAKGGQVT